MLPQDARESEKKKKERQERGEIRKREENEDDQERNKEARDSRPWWRTKATTHFKDLQDWLQSREAVAALRERENARGKIRVTQPDFDYKK